MDTRSNSDRHSSRIDDEIADLSEEVVLISIPVDTTSSVGIGVHQRNAHKASSSLDGGNRDCITDELCVVKLDERGGNTVSSRREVDDCWSRS
jgi:hypothetical protein